MKKFFEKHDLFKILGIMMLFAALLTWILTISYYNSGELTWFNEGTAKPLSIFDNSTIGIFDFNIAALQAFYYFSNIFIFVAIVFGFYKVIGSTESYKAIVERIANVFKGKELIYVIINVVLFAILGSIFTSKLVLFAFIPFSISILNRLKVDKISALMTTFGGSLIGVLSATYSKEIVGSLIEAGGLSVKYGYEFASIAVMAVIFVAISVIFISLRLKNSKGLEVVPDLFTEESKKASKKVKILPMSIVLFVFFAILVLGFTSWSAFNIDIFTNFHKMITDATIGGEGYIYPYVVLGTQTLVAFGEWDLFHGTAFIIIITLLLKFIGRIKIDTIIDNVIDGVKLSLKPIVLLAMIYGVLIISVSYPVIPGIVNAINTTITASVLRPIVWVLSGFIYTVFAVDMQYVASMLGSLFATFGNTNAAALALQASYGIAGFIAPTSVVLMLGLSMLDIKYKDYFKFIWKFLLAVLVVVLVVLYILLYV